MRAAVISLPTQPSLSGAWKEGLFAGKPLARRQLDFARAAGCAQVFAIGNGASPDAVALRHAAEAAGMRFQAIRDGHGLLGAVGAADELLVLAPGLVPEAEQALEALSRGPAVLVVSAGPALSAGFERIDRERAWAGALVVSGSCVERLSELPPDSEAAPALLRIALQARTPERRMAESLLEDGRWSMLGEGDNLVAREREWLARNTPPAPAWSFRQRLADLALRPLAARLLATRRAGPAILAAFLLLLGAAVAAAAEGWAPAGFALVALASVAADLHGRFAALRDAPFGRRAGKWGALPPLLVDAGLAACGVLSIDGSLVHKLFPPLVLLGLLHIGRGEEERSPAGLLRDRVVVALMLAIGAAAGFTEPAIMLAALALVALDAARTAAWRG